MPKSDKATVLRRVHDVERLLLAGAEFTEIRHYASDQGWQVSDRQVRRYLEAAYKRLARSAKRDRRELLGRHLMQRRALYARAFKAGDIRSALQVLRDEASLQGLYPPTKIAPTTPDGEQPYLGGSPSPLSRPERVARQLTAEAKNDKTELRLIEHVTPYQHFRFPDTTLPALLLHILTMEYVTEQLEHAAMTMSALLSTILNGEEDGMWDFVGRVSAYRFRVGQEAWRQFTQGIGVDGDFLVRSNYFGLVLELCGPNVCDLALSVEELRELAGKMGWTGEKVVTAEDLAKSWRRAFLQIFEQRG